MITSEDAPKTLTKKLVAVLNEKIAPGVAVNAATHMSLGMGALLGPDESLMCDYVDADGVHHSSISAYPFIVLSGRPTKIREAVEAAKVAGITVVDFVNTMTVGTYTDQLARTKKTQNVDLDFYGAVFFGEIDAVSTITRKFSLFK